MKLLVAFGIFVCLILPVQALEIGTSLETVVVRLPKTFVDERGPIGSLPSAEFDRVWRGDLEGVRLHRPLRTLELELPGRVDEAYLSDGGDDVYLLTRDPSGTRGFTHYRAATGEVTTVPLDSDGWFSPSGSGVEVLSEQGAVQYSVSPQNVVNDTRSARRAMPLVPDHLTGWRRVNGVAVGYLSFPWGTTVSTNGVPSGNDRSVRFYLPNPLSPDTVWTLRAQPRGWGSWQLDGGRTQHLQPLASRDPRFLVLSDRRSQFYALDASASIRTAILEYPSGSGLRPDEVFPMKVAPDGTLQMLYGGLGESGGVAITGLLPVDLWRGKGGRIQYFAAPSGGFTVWDFNASGTLLAVGEGNPEASDGPHRATLCWYNAQELHGVHSD